jgi:hypothetical protein
MAIRQDKVNELVTTITNLGHYVRSEPGLDPLHVKALRAKFKAALNSSTKEEQAAAWDIVGKP